MAGELKELVVKILADASNYTKGLDKAGTDAQKFEKKTSTIGTGFLAGIGGALGFTAAGLGIASVTGVLSSVTSAITGTISAAAESETVMAQTNAVLASTHGISGQTAQSISDLSTKLMNLSGADDEAIQGAENMLATFTNIRGQAFEPATKAVLNMATAMNGGAIPSAEQLQATAIQVGKALNDPVAGVTALQKVGVKLSDTQLKQVKHFMAVGDAASAQKVILGELNTEFGGAAEAAGGTFSGKLAILQGKLGNVQETIGGAVIPILTKLADKVMPLVDMFADNLPGAITAAEGAFNAMKPPIGFIIDNGDMIKTVLLGVGIGIAAVTAPILIGLVPAFIAWAIAAGAAAVATLLAALPIIAIIAGIALLVVGIKLLIDHWTEVSTFLTNVWNTVVAGVGTGFSSLGTWFHDLGTNIAKFAVDAVGKIGEFINSVVTFFTELPGKVWGIVSSFVVGLATRFVEMELKGLAIIGEFILGVLTFFGGLPGKVWEFVSSLVVGLATRWVDMELRGLAIIAEFISGILNWFSGLPGKVVAFVANLAVQAVAKFEELRSLGIAKVQALVDTAKSIASGILSAIVAPIQAAKDKVSGILGALAGLFSGLHLNLPHISLPHFHISGSFSLNPPSIPSIGVDWYAKGGIFTSPTVAGIGDVPEAVIPLDRLGSMVGGGDRGESGGGYATFELDGRTIVRAFLPYLIDELRRSGAIRDN